MDAAYDASQWGNFALAVAGATAALAGLLVVAISINVREILAGPHLPARAGSALIYVTSPLVPAILVLVPDQSADALGFELLALGVVLGVVLIPLNSPFHLQPQRTRASWVSSSAIPVTLIVVPTILAGIGMVVEALGGLYWLPVAVLGAIVGGLGQAWVLLIEILR
ncbi:MAG: hypothetical protein ACR2HP_18975 [Ilumatobacteraceae bacterium]